MRKSVVSPYVVTIGETLALFYTTDPAPLTHAGRVQLSTGGAESNVAIGLQRLGTNAVWIGRRGADPLGDLVERDIRGEKVVAHCVVDATAPTAVMVKEHRTVRSSRVWYYRAGSAGSRISPDDVPQEIIEDAAVLHITGITPALSASARLTIDSAVARAKSAGTTVSFDVNFRARLWGGRDAGRELRPLLQSADLVFAGIEEAQLFADGEDAATLAAALHRDGPHSVIITLGKRGCRALIDGEAYSADATPATVVDTVGAGDAFVAGYLAALLAGQDPQSRLALAVRVGAFACETAGDWIGMPFQDELALIDNEEPVSR